ncbi:MAG: UvrD-helicase domain-containing protein [Bacilli bacterium]|nr:UvrD-helicase domain-containing protein [Bacilli bacterium]
MISVGGYELDSEQVHAATSEHKNILVVAGAGSGKTTTIVGRIKYLINEKNINSNEILCISFTNASVDSLKDKIVEEIGTNIDVYTFHRLSLNILKDNNLNYKLCIPDLLEYLIDEYFNVLILNDIDMMYIVLKHYHIFTLKIDVIKKYKKILKSANFSKLKKLIAKFIRLMKTNGYNISEFARFYNHKIKTKNFYLLKIILIIYQLYQSELESNGEIDFDDMIIKATNVVKEIGIKNKYKYIIIDEFQDSSLVRFNLIKSIIEKTNASLFVVGDDFQSIYKFAGCNLNIMLDFEKNFDDTEILKISNTYRNSQELVDIAGSFVMKNKKQIRKNLKSNKHLKNPVRIIKYKNYIDDFKKLIEEIGNKKILILGRNNRDIYDLIDNDYIIDKNGNVLYKPKNIAMKYMTVHKSKGLEEDVVIVINLKDDIMGFPSKLEDNKILEIVSPKIDKYPYSEERRLFYVAITRTKSIVYLYVPYANKSIFVDEIKKIVNISKVSRKK